mmetsp:Transcript_69839/g.185627  ORF Transcript_69839/g.185627 Transcript_69839/m.185627 type:complete len:265 (-) Transcript_69839:867-1661(-)
MSSMGWPAWPKRRRPSMLHSYGLVTDLKSRHCRTRLKRWGCNGICGNVRFVGSPLPGITSTCMAAARRANVSSASWSAAFETEPACPGANVPPQTTSRWTASLLPPSPKRKATARSRASARPSQPSAWLPKAKPETSARKGPWPSAGCAATGRGGGRAILGKQNPCTLKWPSSVAEPLTPTTIPVAKLATCSLEATNFSRMELSSSHKTSSSVLSLRNASSSLASPIALTTFTSLYCSMTFCRAFRSLKVTPTTTTSLESRFLL